MFVFLFVFLFVFVFACGVWLCSVPLVSAVAHFLSLSFRLLFAFLFFLFLQTFFDKFHDVDASIAVE